MTSDGGYRQQPKPAPLASYERVMNPQHVHYEDDPDTCTESCIEEVGGKPSHGWSCECDECQSASYRQKRPDECLRDFAAAAWEHTSLGYLYRDGGGSHGDFVEALRTAAASAGVIVVQAR